MEKTTMPTRRNLILALSCLTLLGGLWHASSGEDKFITVASTTSTEQSGLFKYLLPIFTQKTGIEVRVVAQGTGQSLQTASRGDADVALVHDTASEKKFVEDGFGVKRHPVMYNDFIIVGPAADPAKIKGMTDAPAALAKIAAAQSIFVSRGDDSGTHKAELRLWKMAGKDVPKGQTWYRETGSGMGPTLNTTAGLPGYTLTDRGTWLAFQNKQDLTVLVEGDTRLFNQYGVILVNPEKFPHVKAQEGQAFIDWLVSPEGQQAIANYKIGGEQLFFPNANEPGA
jgi:tungstate transport system substrate-binding protein